VINTDTGQIYATNEYKLESDALEVQMKCIPQKDCYRFTIYYLQWDGRHDGSSPRWSLEYDNEFISGGDVAYEKDADSTFFGIGCNGATAGSPS